MLNGFLLSFPFTTSVPAKVLSNLVCMSETLNMGVKVNNVNLRQYIYTISVLAKLLQAISFQHVLKYSWNWTCIHFAPIKSRQAGAECRPSRQLPPGCHCSWQACQVRVQRSAGCWEPCRAAAASAMTWHQHSVELQCCEAAKHARRLSARTECGPSDTAQTLQSTSVQYIWV